MSIPTHYNIPIDAMCRVLVRSGLSPAATGLYGTAVLLMLNSGKPLPADDRKACRMAASDVRLYRRVMRELIEDGALVRLPSGEITAPILTVCRPSRERISTERSARAALPRATREAVLAKTGGKCTYCAVLLVLDDHTSPHAYQPDHVLPVVLGGPDDVANLVPSCRSCNARKRAKTAFQFMGAADDAS